MIRQARMHAAWRYVKEMQRRARCIAPWRDNQLGLRHHNPADLLARADKVIGKLQGIWTHALLQLLRSQIGTNSPYGDVVGDVSFWG
jgi:hypothetical protein